MTVDALERHHPDFAGNSTESQYYQYDHRGNVAVASDAAGRIEAGYQYDAFGNVLPGSFTPAVEETAFALPSAGADIGGGDSYWHDAGNITKESDCAYMEGASGLTSGLKASGFGQEIPAGATILGVEVQIRKDASADVYDGVVRLYDGATETLIGANKAKPDGWPDDPGTVTYGGPDDTWGAALTPDILNHSGTGIVIQGYVPDGERSLNVHWVKLKVYYTEGDAPGPAILFTGKDYDPDLELYYFNARWYDPETGRFVSRAFFDTDIEHSYGFCENEPVCDADPNGAISMKNLKMLSDFSAGMGDSISFGATQRVREWMGTNDVVDPCSDSYGRGNRAGRAWQETALAAGGLAAGGRYAARLPLIGRNGPLFGRGSRGIFNRGAFRTGWSWKGPAKTGRDVFRTAFFEGRGGYWNHLTWF